MHNYNVNLTRFVLADLLDNPGAERAILSLAGSGASSLLSLGGLIHRIIEDGRLAVDVDHVSRRRLQAAISLNRLIQSDKLSVHHLIDSFSACFDYLSASIGYSSRERFMALYLSARKHLLASETLFQGDIASAAVYPRVVVTRALVHHASSVIVAHNHPSGSIEPSRSDIDVTYRLRDALQTLDIELVDHVVVSGADCLSLREAGYL